MTSQPNYTQEYINLRKSITVLIEQLINSNMNPRIVRECQNILVSDNLLTINHDLILFDFYEFLYRDEAWTHNNYYQIKELYTKIQILQNAYNDIPSLAKTYWKTHEGIEDLLEKGYIYFNIKTHPKPTWYETKKMSYFDLKKLTQNKPNIAS